MEMTGTLIPTVGPACPLGLKLPEGYSSFSGSSIPNNLRPQNAISLQGAAGCHPDSPSPHRPPNLLLDPSLCFLHSALPFQRHCNLPQATGREIFGDSYWLGLQLLSAVSQRPADSPVLIMFAYCCLSVVPVCFYSHPSAQLRIVVLSWESLCSGVGLWFGHHLDSRQREKSKKNAWFTEHCEGCCEG